MPPNPYEQGMSDNQRPCPQCGAPLEPGKDGLCTKCLLKLAVEEKPQGAFKPGENFHGLEIVELLGRGGMGEVYKARQRDLERFVALKILPSALGKDPEFALRFMREAKALANLNHPNIVAVYDFGREGDHFFFVMEYVDGTSLRPLLEQRKLSAKEALQIVPTLCEALTYAHAEGVVHRDLKPENILLDKKGRVKLADFGLAKILNADQGNTRLTSSQVAMGTPHYMAPEQMSNFKSVDHRADIYSLGVLFYEMLTGELPLGRFAPPSQRVQVDVRFDEIVLKTLENEPSKRYQSMEEVRRDVTGVRPSNKQVKAAQPKAPEAGQKAPMSTFTKSLVVGLCILFFLTLFLWSSRRDQFKAVTSSQQTATPPAPTAVTPQGTAAPTSAQQATKNLEEARALMQRKEFALALQAAQQGLNLDPVNPDLLTLAREAATAHAEMLYKTRSAAAAAEWLDAQIQHFGYLAPLLDKYAAYDTEAKLRAALDKGGDSRAKFDLAFELVHKYPSNPAVPFIAAKVLRERMTPSSCLRLYEEGMKRAAYPGYEGPEEAWTAIVATLQSYESDDNTAEYARQLAQEYFGEKSVKWGEAGLDTAAGYLYTNIFRLLHDANRTKPNEGHYTELNNVMNGLNTTGALAGFKALGLEKQRQIRKQLLKALELNQVPEKQQSGVEQLARQLAD